MIKQLIIPLAAVAAFIVIVGIFSQKSGGLDWSKFLSPSPALQEKTVTIGSKSIQVEIADTENLREKGLGGRTTLGPDNGMLFVFAAKQQKVGFWMKDMKIPLDIIWISGGKIIKIDKNIPPPAPGTPDGALTEYNPGELVDYVLEVNGGFSDGYNFKVGDSVVLPTL